MKVVNKPLRSNHFLELVACIEEALESDFRMLALLRLAVALLVALPLIVSRSFASNPFAVLRLALLRFTSASLLAWLRFASLRFALLRFASLRFASLRFASRLSFIALLCDVVGGPPLCPSVCGGGGAQTRTHANGLGGRGG